MVITGRTRNALALRGTWVQIPPSPHIKSRYSVKTDYRLFVLEKCAKNVFIFQKNVLCLPQNLHDRIIMLRIMREGAARAILDPSAIFLEIPGIPGAVLQAVHGAVAEQAVEICKSLVAGEIFTIFILKKTIGIFHLQHSHPSITCKVCALAQICV